MKAKEPERLEKLLPCPFCGKQPKVVIAVSTWFVIECARENGRHRVAASGCTYGYAARRWNRRAR